MISICKIGDRFDYFNAIVCIQYFPFHTGDAKNYIDWRMPTIMELSLMYEKRDLIGGFYPDKYWSSLEAGDANVHYYLNFIDGTNGSGGRTEMFRFRPEREF